MGGRSQEGFFWAEQSAGQGLEVEAGPALPARRGRGSAPGMPRRGGWGGASAAPPLTQVANGCGGPG